eukprot:403345192
MQGNEKSQTTCPDCDIVSTQPEEMKESPKIIKYLKQLDQLTIICDEHQSKTTAKYCLKCETPVCIECEIGTHKDHNIIDLKQSKFVTYTENVKNLIDEYSTHNLKSKLDKYAYNEIQINSSHFKTMISKIQRMLGYLVDEEERIKIDLPTCLGEPQNDPQILQKKSNIQGKPIAAGIIAYELTENHIKHLINESQSILREEFKQALEAFENASIKKEKILTDQTNLRINDIQQGIASKLQQYKEEIQSDFDIRFKEVVQENTLNSQQQLKIDQKHDKLADLLKSELIKGGIDKKFKLLFRGSTHGFTASKFHELCDNQGPTISFILSEQGQVFGGYASLPWTSPPDNV